MFSAHSKTCVQTPCAWPVLRVADACPRPAPRAAASKVAQGCTASCVHPCVLGGCMHGWKLHASLAWSHQPCHDASQAPRRHTYTASHLSAPAPLSSPPCGKVREHRTSLLSRPRPPVRPRAHTPIHAHPTTITATTATAIMLASAPPSTAADAITARPVARLEGYHRECVRDCSWHPHLPLLATGDARRRGHGPAGARCGTVAAAAILPGQALSAQARALRS